MGRFGRIEEFERIGKNLHKRLEHAMAPVLSDGAGGSNAPTALHRRPRPFVDGPLWTALCGWPLWTAWPLGVPGVSLGGPWGALGGPWGALGVSGGSLGALGSQKGAQGSPGGAFGSPWGVLGGPWRSLGDPWGSLGDP